MRKHYALIAAICLHFGLFAQDGPPNSEEEYAAAYARRIQQSELFGVYIPADLGEAFVQLNKLTDAASKETFRRYEETDAVRHFFNSFGRWIIHNWGFYGGSRFSHYLTSLNLQHPEDMAVFTMIAYHRHLNKKPLDPKPLIDDILQRRQAKLQNRYLGSEVIEEKVMKRTDGGQ